MSIREIQTRVKEPKKQIVDEATRKRRREQALENLEKDNYQPDPHGDLVMSKKIPKFHDGDQKEDKKRAKAIEAFRLKYRKTFAQLLEDEKQRHGDGHPNYMSVRSPPPRTPPRKFCAVCGYISNYTCTVCGTRFCCIPCMKIHQETRCLKWTV